MLEVPHYVLTDHLTHPCVLDLDLGDDDNDKFGYLRLLPIIVEPVTSRAFACI